MKKLKLPKGNVLRHFYTIKEFRQEKKIRHKLIDIITIAICAVVSGAENYQDIGMYASAMGKWLKRILELPNGVPSHDTFERVFKAINPDEFRKCFLRWVREVAKLTDGEIVSIDGKTLRGSKDGGRSAIHMISAWAGKNGIVLGQLKVDGKSNEITAIPELLKVLELKGCIITIDAIGCQKDIAEQIIEKEADYVLALKENQESLYHDVKLYFEGHYENCFEDIEYDYYYSIEKRHGRIDKRKYWITEDMGWLFGREKWAGLRSIGMVESERIIGEKKSIERRYYITSIKANAKVFARAVRGHWGIENSLHWVMDVVFYEDNVRIRKDYGPENMAVMRHVVLNLMKRDTQTKISLRQKKKLAQWRYDYGLSLIFGELSGEDF